MLKIKFAGFFSFSLALAFYFGIPAKAIHKNNQYPFVQNEKFVVQALVVISGAQATYQAIHGNYGTLDNLRQADFIDSVLATGDKYGYRFTVSKTDSTATTPAKFYVTATPRLYRKTGRRSFYIDESGETRGADKSGESANSSDPLVETCFSGNEGCTISSLRSFSGAQIAYASAIGNGNYGTLNQLYQAGLISRNFSVVPRYGYVFDSTTNAATATTPASFKIRATPVNYGVSGVRSFYVDESGVIRGADKRGAYADANDPPIQ